MKEEVTLTLTATVGGMLPPKPGDLMLLPSQVFGQMFVRLNGEVVPDSYLLVKEGQVSHKAQGAGAGRGFNELHQEVRHRQGDWGHTLDHPPQRPSLALKTSLLGGSYF